MVCTEILLSVVLHPLVQWWCNGDDILSKPSGCAFGSVCLQTGQLLPWGPKNNNKRRQRCNAKFAARLTAPGQRPAPQLLKRFDAHDAVVHSQSTALCQDHTAHQNYRLLISDGLFLQHFTVRVL